MLSPDFELVCICLFILIQVMKVPFEGTSGGLMRTSVARMATTIFLTYQCEIILLKISCATRDEQYRVLYY